MYGPPGTGKTLLARAVAHHTDCTFIRVSGSELVQKYIGEGSRMVRELFIMAREHAPSLIFMDEIDSIGAQRIESGGGGDSEVQRTMLELLNQLDGFEASNNIKVIMATNRLDILDSALLRPGRIDRKIEFPHPNEAARTDILKIHSRRMNLMRGINLQKIAAKERRGPPPPPPLGPARPPGSPLAPRPGPSLLSFTLPPPPPSPALPSRRMRPQSRCMTRRVPRPRRCARRRACLPCASGACT